jgi:hypothetical protein
VSFFDADRLAGRDQAEVNFYAAQKDAAAVNDDCDCNRVKGVVGARERLLGG